MLWEKIAAHFRGNPAVAGYDLLNEPFCSWRYDSGRADRELHEMLYEVYDTAYRRIRAIDPDHLIIFEAVWDPSDLPNPRTYGWTNVMYEYHQYEYSDYDNREGAQIAALKRKLRKIRRAGYDVPSYLGEFTLFNSMEAWEEGLSLLQKRNISWTFWSYKCMVQNDNWGIVRLDAEKVNPETDSYEEILEKWSAISDAQENTALTEVLREALK